MRRPKRAPILSPDALEVWFDTVEPPAHCGGVSMMNGFLTGLAAGPVFLQPNQWMWHVVGDHEKRAYVGNKMQAVIDTVVDHYNLIARQLANPGKYAPVFMRTDEKAVLPEPWADGFFGAMRLTMSAWAPLFTRQETAGPIMTILVHASAADAAEIYRQVYGKSFKIDRKESWRALPIAVEDLYRHCTPMRGATGAPANNG